MRPAAQPGLAQVFPRVSDTATRVEEVTAALPRLAGVNLLAVHLTADGYAEVDRGRLPAATAEIVNQATGHDRPLLTAEEFAAAVVALPGFDPDLPVVLVGCPAGSDFAEAFGRALARRTAPAGGQPAVREVWTARQYAWQTHDGRVLATSLAVTADGRPRLVGSPEENWVRRRFETAAGRRVSRTQHGPDLMDALRAAMPDLHVEREPSALPRDYHWSNNTMTGRAGGTRQSHVDGPLWTLAKAHGVRLVHAGAPAKMELPPVFDVAAGAEHSALPMLDYDAIALELLIAGPESRGLVLARDRAGTRHEVLVVFDGTRAVFLDTQTGGLGRLPANPAELRFVPIGDATELPAWDAGDLQGVP